MRTNAFIFLLLLINFSILAQDSSQIMIPLNGTGVSQFLTEHPEYDGRGTIIIVLDTGIDMAIDGLISTSLGETKVIDLQDFTGQGDIQFYPAEIDEIDGTNFFINEQMNLKISGAGKLPLASTNDKYFIGALPENFWRNSIGLTDLNENGTEDDLFEFVTFEDSEGWVLFIDTNDDDDLSDEKPLRNYKLHHDYFVLPNDSGLSQLTIAVNIIPQQNKVSFIFDDSGHGTHCAGIAAGSNIGNVGVNGVAPGAKLIGLKIGNNNYSGGSTITESMKNAYLYADKLSKELNQPCIVTMSYGIGSEIEGHSDMELFLEELVSGNPYLYISKSNDNEGPGISTTGLPSNTWAVFNSGAVLTKEVGNNLYGALLDKDIILHFSSRGAESMKPDVVSPGACSSTVPNYDNTDRKWGTSMATPYTAGVMSLLLSAMQQEFPGVKIPSQFLYKVLREGADKWNEYDHIDQGSGYVNVVNAYAFLKKYINAGELQNFETYSITTFTPSMPNAEAPNLYIRNGSFLTGNEDFTIKITRKNSIKQNKFFRKYVIKSDKDWVIPTASKLHLRNDQPGVITVKFDKSKMNSPGLYNAKISACRDDKSNILEFETMITVVIPHQFNDGNNYSQSWKDQVLEPGMHNRYYLNVPPGASNTIIKINSEPGRYTYLRYYLHDPDGRQKKFALIDAGDNGVNDVQFYNNPQPGVYELVVLGNFTSKNISHYDLTVKFDGLKLTSQNEVSDKKSEIEITNLFKRIVDYKLDAKILGCEQTSKIHLNKVEKYSIPFVMKSTEESKRFSISISKEDFNKVTDFAFFVIDEEGKIHSKSALNYHEGNVLQKNIFTEDEKKFELVLVPGFANEAGTIDISITETTYLYDQPTIRVYDSKLKLYPTMTRKFVLNYSFPLIDLPNNTKFLGCIYFNDIHTDKTEYKLPIYFNYRGGSK